MAEYRVELEHYCGPLDLLMFLVKRDEIDLNDIPIARLTDQYLHWLDGLKRIDINVAGEFLVMAATLLEIKSRMIVPESGDEEEKEQPTSEKEGLSPRDPRYELVQQLLEYRRIKQVSQALEARLMEWERRFASRPIPIAGQGEDDEDSETSVPIDLDEVNLFDLCRAFAKILSTIGDGPSGHEVIDDDTPTALHQADLVDQLERRGTLRFREVMQGRQRTEMVGLFVAMLELVRRRMIRFEEDGDDFVMHMRPEEDRVIQDQNVEDRWVDPATGTIQYDWPSERERLRAERRAKLRQTYAGKKAEALKQAESEREPDDEQADSGGFDDGDDEPDVDLMDDAEADEDRQDQR
ncbi:MAG: segregation/condensation protein A [Phycisphaeraceae bacterium]|nr:segregation/condensation protein A [Phycisphaeraceae bacterium]